MKKRFYAIRKGRKTGVFYGYWKDVEKYVKGFSHPEFEGFDSIERSREIFEYGE